MMSSNLLIVYFSQSNHTRQLAQAIQRQTGGALAELLPAPPIPHPIAPWCSGDRRSFTPATSLPCTHR